MRISKTTSVLLAWGSYEAASQAFPFIVRAFIFAAYFTTQVSLDPITGTYYWGNASALAGLAIALLSPFLGAIADSAGYCKRWLVFFTLLCIISSSLLWFAYPSPDYVYYMLACVIIGTISFEMGHVFYNAYLPRISPPNLVGRVSGVSYGAGALGGIVALFCVMFFFVKTPPSWLDTQTAAQIRICGPFVAIWMTLLSIPFVLFIPDTPSKALGVKKALVSGWKETLHTLKNLPHEKNLLLFIIANMIYKDGMITLFTFAGIYAAGTFHLSILDLLYYGIATNVFTSIGAAIFGWIDDKIGSKPTLLIALTALCILGVPLVLTEKLAVFWWISMAISVFIGPIQATSRSLMTKLCDPEKSAGMFGIFALSGKISAFVGPWIFGLTSLYFQSQRPGVATIFLFFLVGGLLLLFVNESGRCKSSKSCL